MSEKEVFKSVESHNFLDEYAQLNKRNSGFIQVNTAIFYLHEASVIDDKELIFLCRLLGDCNAQNSSIVRISHSRVMKFASCGKEKANKIIKRMVNDLKFLIVTSFNKRSGYLYRLDLNALEAALKLNYNLFVERSSESSINEVVNYDNRTGDLRLSGCQRFDERTQIYIDLLIKDYYSYIRCLSPQAKVLMASELWRLEKKGFDRQAIKFFIELNKVNLEGIRSIYALISSHGKEYFQSLELIKQSFEVKKPESVKQSQLVAESITKDQKPLTEKDLKEIEEAKKFLAEFLKNT